MHFFASSVTVIFGNQKKWLDFAGKLSGSHFFFEVAVGCINLAHFCEGVC